MHNRQAGGHRAEHGALAIGLAVQVAATALFLLGVAAYLVILEKIAAFVWWWLTLIVIRLDQMFFAQGAKFSTVDVMLLFVLIALPIHAWSVEGVTELRRLLAWRRA